jgi:YidC/Oxa1 family membrane protein insertase
LLLNAAISPKKHVDYEALERSRAALAEIERAENAEEKKKKEKENKKREREDYRRFFSIANKHLVIYSEKSGFYKYFKGLIRELLSRSSVVIHYVTNDPNDVIFEIAKREPRIKPYYISLKKTISLMLKLECDMVVMTTPDLDKYYLKKSMMKKDIEYVYIPHALMSMHMGMKEGSLDAFDTIFCAGAHIKREVIATEQVYGLPKKELVEFGYPLVDDLIELGEAERKTHKTTGRKEILIAPTWNEDNILDSCIDEMLNRLLCEEYHVTVRPHPEYVKRYGARMNAIVERWKDRVGDGLTFELDFSSNKSIYSSDLMITDWSGISFEFSFATKRPTLFVNTKMKVLNENWQKIDCTPIEITLRDEIGISIEKSGVADIDAVVKDMFKQAGEHEKRIEKALHTAVYNVGHADPVGAKYILRRLIEKQEARRK